MWFGRSIIAAVPKPFLNDDAILFLLGALNSQVVNDQYKKDTGESGRVFAQVKKAKLEALLLPDPRELSAELVSETARQVRRLTSLLCTSNGDDSGSEAANIIGKLEQTISKAFRP